MVWLIIAGPLAVVVAGFWTLGIALTHVDPVVVDTGAPAATTGHADVPAQSARNHAATSRALP
jgi:ribulose 1,5-bisphosphate synthetase/thiazole synthase